MRLKAVLFDLWGTLILDPPELSRPRQVFRATSVQTVLADHGLQVALDSVLEALNKASVTLGAMQDRGEDLQAGGRARLFAGLLEEHYQHVVPESAIHAVEEAIGHMPVQFQPVCAPYAVEAVEQVRAAGMTTILISNAGLTTHPNLRRMLRDYGLLPHFDALVFSDELGIAKPDERIFRAALDGLAISPSECAFIGDSPLNDISGAMNAGMFTIQIGDRSMDGIMPHARIDHLNQLSAALRTHERTATAG